MITRVAGVVGWSGLATVLVLAAQSRVGVEAELLGAVALGGIVLALLLRQGRSVLALAVVAAVGLAGWLGLSASSAELALVGLGPLLVGLGLGDDVHPFGRRMARRLVGLGVLAAVVRIAPPGPTLQHVLSFDLLPRLGSPPPQLAEVVFGLALLVLGTTTLIRAEPARRAAFWSTVGMVCWWRGVEVGALAAVAAWIVGALDAAHTLAWRDALTRLPSRRAFDRELADLPRRYAIAMVDVDFFKKLNDSWGHDVGDQVLAMVGTELAATRGARAFRYGGEEFALVFRGRAADRAPEVLERLRERIAKRRFTVRTASGRRKSARGRGGGAAGLKVTASIGWAEAGSKRPDPAAVLGAADRALYRAKEAGRNRVVGALK